MINIEAYETVIDELMRFVEDVSDGCERINSAAQDYVDNTDFDDSAISTKGEIMKGKINYCNSNISAACDDIRKVVQALQDELESLKWLLTPPSLPDSDD